jgi:PHD/YefM family antitoxin component YafN of YafNO toxin-antitoxin module
MVAINDIYSLTDFQRKTREHMQRLKETRRPHVLTVNGKAEIVVQDAEAYQAMVELIDRAAAIVAIREGLDSMERGEGRDAFEALRDLREKRRSTPGA